MDGDASGFTFSTTDFKAQDAADPMSSWGDRFLDSIHSDDPASSDASGAGITDSGLGPPLQNASQPTVNRPLQIRLTQPPEGQQVISDSLTNIPTRLQASVPNNNSSIVQQPQSNTSSIASVSYLNPSQPQQQQFTSVGNIQNVLSANQQQQQQGSHGNTKLVQITPSFPVATVQQLPNNLPLQTLLQPNQPLAGQTIYSNPNQGLFPQNSVHIENPKVVNVNFGPHVIQQDSSGQQAIIQTAEGKRVLITNQLQHLPQSLSLSQPIMGTHLINTGGSVNHVIRTTMAQTGPTLVPSSTSNPRQIVLPTGQTVIPRQPGGQQTAGFSKNVVLRQINPNVQSVIYQGGQNNVAGQIIQSPQTLIASSGAGLQVVSAGAGNQGNQVQLIAQPSINQTAMGQQQINQNTLMNLIGSQGMIPNAGNQISNIVSGQNILVNGQMLNISQLGGLAAIPQLQVQSNNGADTTTVTGINTAGSRTNQFQATNQQQVFIQQQQNGQQQIMLQPKTNTPSPSLLVSSDANRVNFQGKSVSTPVPNTNSASSTPALTPTPSTPTPTPTPDNVFDDLCGSGTKTNHNNILEQALMLSSIDFNSIEEDDLNFLDETMTDNNSSVTAPVLPPPQPAPPPVLPKTKPQPTPKPKAKTPKSKQQKQIQPIVNVTVNNNLQRNTTPQQLAQNMSGQKVSLSPQQKLIKSGQVYILSADGQQLVLQPRTTNSLTGTIAKPMLQQSSSVSQPSSTNISRPNINIPATGQAQVRLKTPGDVINNRGKIQIATNQSKIENQQLVGPGLKTFAVTNQSGGSHVFVKAGMGALKSSIPVSSSQSLPQISPALSSQSHYVQVKNQQISTLAGKFIKQEPVAVVKQETPETKPFSFFNQTQTSSSASPATTSIIGISASHTISASSIVSTATVTTASHDTSIMSTVSSQAVPNLLSNNQVVTSNCLPTIRPSVIPPEAVQPQTNIPVSSQTPVSTQASGKSSKSKEISANFKSLTQIKIANTTLTLSLTAQEKERLETEVSSMSMEKQAQFLSHQQNIIRRSQEKQMEQQQRLKNIQQKQKQNGGSTSEPKASVPVPVPVVSSHSPGVAPMKVVGKPINSVVSSLNASTLPTTIQELEEKLVTSSEVNQPPEKLWQHQQQPMQRQPISLPQETPCFQGATPTQAPAPVQSFSYSSVGRCLAEQQLSRDRSLAVSPDTSTGFKSLSDAMRRLVRFHTMQDHKPELDSEEMNAWDTKYSEVCEQLVQRKRRFMRRFNKLLMYHDMCPEKWPENYHNIKCFNENLEETLARQKEEVIKHPESYQQYLCENQRRFSPDHDDSLQSEQSSSEEEEEEEERESDEESMEDETSENGLASQRDYSSTLAAPGEIKIKMEIKSEPFDSQPVYNSSVPSTSSVKRKCEEQTSSGTLKLVFKRRNTDQSFTVKNSSLNSSVPGEMKPTVNMEKCDSLYEFDSKSNCVEDSSSVLVRRRESSVSFASRQTSSDNRSIESSFMSNNEKDENSEEEEEETGEQGVEYIPSDEELMEDNMKEKSVERSDMPYAGANYMSYGNEQVKKSSSSSSLLHHNHSSAYLNSDDPEVDLNQLTSGMTEWVANPSMKNFPDNRLNCDIKPEIRYSDISAPETHSGNSSLGSKKSDAAGQEVFRSQKFSTTSDDVFITSHQDFQMEDVGFPEHYKTPKKRPYISSSDRISSNGDMQTGEPKLNSSHGTDIERNFVPETPPINQLETDSTSEPFSSTVLFPTPNKSLLQTDAMFNTSSEDEDLEHNTMSSFKIDNRDPQSSLVSDSIQTAINSVINSDDDDSVQIRNSARHGWASSSSHPQPFFPSSLSSSVRDEDLGLDAAVQSILNPPS